MIYPIFLLVHDLFFWGELVIGIIFDDDEVDDEEKKEEKEE